MFHGLTGSPAELRLVGEHLNARGYAVTAPLLPGHGTSPADLARRSRGEWTGAADAALQTLAARCERVYACGVSMGALLALWLAEERPEITGVIACSPVMRLDSRLAPLLPALQYLVRGVPVGEGEFSDPSAATRLWGYDVYPTHALVELRSLQGQVRGRLSAVTCPLLVLRGGLDRTSTPAHAELLLGAVSSADKALVVLPRSGHVLTVDAEWQEAAERIDAFISSHPS